MRPNDPLFDPSAFAAVPAQLFAAGDASQWAFVQELYRLALERARAEAQPTPTDRLGAYWN